MQADGSPRTVALITAPRVIEEWLDPLGVSFEDFRERLTGGWMFNYVDALATAAVRTVIVCWSDWVEAAQSFEHGPTGATVWMLPAAGTRRARRWVAEPPLEGTRDVRSLPRGVRRHLAPYLLTPPRQLQRILRHERCDAVLSQDFHSQRFDACVLLGRILRIPVFATFQGGGFPGSLISDVVRPMAIRAAAGLIVPARLEAERVRARYGVSADKLAQIPNPLDVAEWRPVPRAEAREALGIALDARVVITHGRIDIDDKGLDILLDAWASVGAARPSANLKLIMVGTGDDSAEVARMIDGGRYPGAELVDEFIVDGDVLRRYLSAADIFAFAGRYEGFPVAPTEAMACALPVVATDASGIPDLLGTGDEWGGLVVAREDPQALAGALGRVLDDPDLSLELGRRARRRVEEYCSLESVGRQLEQFLTGRGMRPDGP